jgi:hypothetical protein
MTKKLQLYRIRLLLLLLSYFIELPLKMEPIECSETSAISIQTPGKHPKENILHLLFPCFLVALHVSSYVIAHHQEHLNCSYSFWFYSRVLAAAAKSAADNDTRE